MWMDDKIFALSVENCFIFLQEEYGMHIKDQGIIECVHFESNVAWIEIWLEKYSLFIEMGTNDGIYRTSLWDVMQFLTQDGNSASYMASDEEKLIKGLQRLSNFVRLYCRKTLLGDVEFYKAVQTNKEMCAQEQAFKKTSNFKIISRKEN